MHFCRSEHSGLKEEDSDGVKCGFEKMLIFGIFDAFGHFGAFFIILSSCHGPNMGLSREEAQGHSCYFLEPTYSKNQIPALSTPNHTINHPQQHEIIKRRTLCEPDLHMLAQGDRMNCNYCDFNHYFQEYFKSNVSHGRRQRIIEFVDPDLVISVERCEN